MVGETSIEPSAAASVLLLSQPTSGGVARHVYDLATGLAARGWDVAVGCAGTPWLPERLSSAGVPVHVLPLVRPISPLSDTRAFLACRRLLRRLRPGLVHAHSSKAGIIGRAAARSLGLRALYTPHCMAFVGAGRGLRSRVYRFAERLAAPWCEVFVAVADAEVREIEVGGLAGRDRIRRIHNGIAQASVGPPSIYNAASEAPVAARQTPHPSQAVVFTVIGRADRQKAFDVFVKAALLARTNIPHARFIAVGGDYTRKGALDALRAQVARAGAKDIVSLLGEQPDPEVVLSCSDVLVLPSRWEAFPYALLEAGRHALPVIATRVGGVDELVEEGATGMLVPVDDPVALADAMVRMAGDPKGRARMGRAMAQRTASFTLDRMVDEMVNIYDWVLANRDGGRGHG